MLSWPVAVSVFRDLMPGDLIFSRNVHIDVNIFLTICLLQEVVCSVLF